MLTNFKFAVVFIVANLNREKYISDILEEVNALYGILRRRQVFPHVYSLTCSFKVDNNIPTLFWPPMSPSCPQSIGSGIN